MDGFQVIKEVRSVLNNKDIKILIFSNLSQKEDQDKAMKLGADGFIIKSDYSPTDLVKEVSRMINQYEEIERNESIKDKERKAPASSDSEKKKVLIIEDEEIFLEMFGEKLRQDGYAVETAANGAWGLKAAFENKFDLFVIDMVMPAMTGEEIVEKLKMDERTKNIPIIILSASVEKETEEKVKKLGVDEFFVKTQIIPSELSKKVGELLV
jgi:CheY-like chemotaxis protein